MGELNETQRYFVEEYVEDFRDGFISRRELLRKVTLIVGSTAAASTILAACDLSPRGGAGGIATPTATAGTTVGGGATPTPSSGLVAAGPFATPPSAATTDGITVKPDDPRIAVSKPEVKGPDGGALMAYMAKPNVSGRVPGVVVIHENRGQTEHIRDVVRRAATAGFVAINIDLLAREGGADRLGDGYSGALGRRTLEQKVADHRATIDYLKTQSSGTIGVTGFCFGGGETWNILAAGLDVKAGVPYYGPAPSAVADLAKTKAAVFGVYAQQDTRITDTAPTIETQLKTAGVPYQITIYPNVNHAFHNDTGTRYNAEAAQRAWTATIEWFRKYLV
jgi:carboxymethylenebutenolidase